MANFEQPSNIVISGGHFYYNGSTYLEQNPDSQALNSIKRIVEKDADFNEYSATGGTVMLPLFTKNLLLNITGIITGAACRSASGSCCFDLMHRLGLLQGQPNSGLAEYEPGIPIAEVVARNSCCCARISRHGFVHLVSRFFQDASVDDTPGAACSITINTTIGRFKCYEIDDRTYVHFDSSTRSSPVTELVDNQNLDHILRVAHGQYMMMDNSFTEIQWRTEEEDQIPACAAGNYFSIPDAIMYMPREKIATWTLLRTFGRMVATCTLQYIDTLRAPRSFYDLLAAQQHPNFDMDSINVDTAPEALSQSVLICRMLLHASPVAMTHELYRRFGIQCVQAFIKAHQHYRSPRAEAARMPTSSLERFLRMFRVYRDQETNSVNITGIEAAITSELQSLIQTTENNIALVVYQAFIGLTVCWNAGRVLSRSREVPMSWIRFVSAQDDYIYLG